MHEQVVRARRPPPALDLERCLRSVTQSVGSHDRHRVRLGLSGDSARLESSVASRTAVAPAIA